MNSLGKASEARQAWMAHLLEPGILVRRAGTTEPFKLVVGRHWGHTVLAVPVDEVVLGSTSFYRPRAPAPGDCPLFAVCDISKWEVQELRWCSPLHVGLQHPGAFKAIAGKPEGGVLPALTLAAKRAFWNLPLGVLND
eukprot:6033696-Lingulodinium_polyedra.AAC.1